MYTSLISAEQLLQHFDAADWRIIDCRFFLDDTEAGRQAYADSHIPYALYAHLDEDLSGPILAGQTGRHPLPSLLHMTRLFSSWGIDHTTQVVVYDQGHGGIAARLWWMLKWLGHEAVAVLDGGWMAWKRATYPTTAVEPVLTKSNFIPKIQEDWIIVAEALTQGHGYDLIDSRAAARFRGEEEPIDPVAGHIPGARNLPFADNLTTEGAWKSKAILKARFEDTVESDPVFYCGSGVTACHNLLARYHAGLGMGKLYPGSWSEWITDVDRPVVKERLAH